VYPKIVAEALLFLKDTFKKIFFFLSKDRAEDALFFYAI
jgi:hypothetical protein